MSALPPKADIGTQSWNVRFVPKADNIDDVVIIDALTLLSVASSSEVRGPNERSLTADIPALGAAAGLYRVPRRS